MEFLRNSHLNINIRYEIIKRTNEIRKTGNEMTKHLILIEGHSAKRYVLTKNVKPIVDVRSRTYRTDDKWCWKDKNGRDSVIIYDLDSNQPYDAGTEIINPDQTMCEIDLGKANHSKNVTILGQLAGLDGMKWVYIAVAFIILFSFLSGII